jgi:hypothetical protein
MTASAAIAYAGGAAFATQAPHVKLRPLKADFSVLRGLHIADASSAPRESIGGTIDTVPAGTFASGDSVYVATLVTGDVCLVDQEPVAAPGAVPNDTDGLIDVACSHPLQAEQSGTGIATPSVNGSAARITLLVPNGVQTVSFNTSDGATITEAVVNNVAQYASPDLVSASFVTPDGQGVSEAVPTPAASQ